MVEKIRRSAVRCVKRTDNFSAQQQKNSDKREIKCQNHLSTLHPLFKKDFLVAELMGKVGRRKSPTFSKGFRGPYQVY